MSDADEQAAPVAAVQLNAHFTVAAKQRINEFLKSFVSFKPTLVLLYGDAAPNGGVGSWSISAYGEKTIAEMRTLYAGFGAPLYYEIDGIRLLLPQTGRSKELHAVELDFVGDRLRAAPLARS